MNIARLKIELLVYGMQIDLESLALLEFKSDKYQHNNRHCGESVFNTRIPQEIKLFSEEQNIWIVVGVLLRLDSPYKLIFSDKLLLYLNDTPLDVTAKLLDEPYTWSQMTSDGQPMHRIISIPGYNEINLWTWHDCGFQIEGMGCAFCTTTKTSRQLQNSQQRDLLSAYNLLKSSSENILNIQYPIFLKNSIEALNTVLTKDYPSTDYWLTIIGGNLSMAKLDINALFVSNLIHDLIANIPCIDSNKLGCNIMPPNDFSYIKDIKHSGAGFFMMNIEIWDDAIWSKVCPGKSRYGKKKFVEAMTYAVCEFGPGKVWCNFVCGIEPMYIQLTGFSELASKGIVPGANIFHKDPGAKANFFENYTVDDYASFYLKAADILHKNGLQPFYSLESRRSSLLWEAYLGIL